MKKKPVNISATVRKEAEEWGVLGANMGRAMVVGTLLAVWLASTKAFYTRTYEIKPFLFGLWQRKTVASVQIDEDLAIAKMIGAAALLVLIWIVGLNTIF